MSPDVVTPVSQVDFINSFLEAIYKDVHRVSDLLHKMGIKESVISALRQDYLRPYLLVLMQRWQAVLRDELPERHAEILIRRYALHSQSPPTLNTLGEEYGVSRERIRQLQEKACDVCGCRVVANYSWTRHWKLSMKSLNFHRLNW